jgi:hypothetical protein
MASTRQQKPCRFAGRRTMLALCLISALLGADAEAGGYPRETVEAFIASCQGNQPLNADQEAYCRCMIGVLQSRVPYPRFAEWERRVTAGERVPELDEEVRTASTDCGR